MWEAVSVWLKAIAVVVLLGNVAEFLLPDSSIKRYAGLVVGLVLLIFMVRPLGQILAFVQHPGHAAVQMNSLTGGMSVQQLIKNEQNHEIEAMVKTLPGVQSCRVDEISPGSFTVRVDLAAGVSQKTLKTFVDQSVASITQEASPSVSLIVQRVPQSAAPTSVGPGRRLMP